MAVLRACLLIFSLLAGPAIRAAEIPVKEYQVKAVFLYNFAQFVAWPESAFNKGDAPLVLGVIGDDPFNDYLDEVVRGEKVGGHPIKVARFKRMEDIRDCHILFVSTSESQRLEPILAGLRNRSILTVPKAP